MEDVLKGFGARKAINDAELWLKKLDAGVIWSFDVEVIESAGKDIPDANTVALCDRRQ
ncbi:MAG: hypothetical protein KGL63_06980 [Betaproteobacteria bacterium]|nr:hypothetical protein [Betaproteobacteria bacterium]